MADEVLTAEMEAVFAEQAQASPEEEEARVLEAANPIVERLSKQAADAVSLRREIEYRWLEDLRQYSGVRPGEKTNKDGTSPGATSETGESTLFVNITRPKTNRTEGRLLDILFPADDKNWGISPTPVPELSLVAKRAMQEAEAAAKQATQVQNGDIDMGGGAQPEELLQKAADLGKQGAEAQKELDVAKKAAENMAREIDDQLTGCRYPRKARDAIGWACKLGVGILKGPLVKDCSRQGWKKGEDGAFALKINEETSRASVECTKPHAFFPDPSATSMDDCEYVYERHLPSKQELRTMAKRLRFNPIAVKQLLEDGPDMGTGSDLTHLMEIRSLTGETTAITNRYVLWEYHGPLQTDEIVTLIKAMGGEGADQRAEAFTTDGESLDSVNVIAYFCNGRLLKISEYYPMDSGQLIYSVFSLEKGEASVLGAIGVPRMMRDSQEALNAAWRMMMDNSGLSTGPQLLIDKAAVQPADGSWQMAPRKSWLWDSAHSQGGQMPFNVFSIPSNQEELAGIITLAMSFIDEETAMPRVSEGGGSMEQAAGVANTVGGLAMLMNAAGVNIRRMVKNWDDDVTSPLIERIYDWNMQYSDKDEIKGDMQVEARGTGTLLVREEQAQNLSAMAMSWTQHPVLGPMLKPYDMARMTLQALSINPDDVLISQDEYDKRMEAAAQAPTEEPDPQWEVRLKIAEIDANARLEEAAMERDVAILKLSESSKIDVAKIGADLEAVRVQSQSSERKLAAEIAVEARNKRDAEAQGKEPTGSGGAVSMGMQEAA